MTRPLTAARPAMTDTGLLTLRLAVAAVFVAHGIGDVFDAGAGIPVPELGVASLTLLLLGSGRFSRDALLVRRRDRSAGATHAVQASRA